MVIFDYYLTGLSRPIVNKSQSVKCGLSVEETTCYAVKDNAPRKPISAILLPRYTMNFLIVIEWSDKGYAKTFYLQKREESELS